MTNRRQLEQHRHGLAEIREIMNAMKNLAYMENRKLERFLGAQSAVVSSIETVAQDFVSAYPETLPTGPAPLHSVYLLIGSERGFCGDFNDALLEHLEASLSQHEGNAGVQVIATGHKLHAALADDPRVLALLTGAGIADEVDAVLVQLVDQLATLQARHGVIKLYAIYHSGDAESICSQQLLPPFQAYRSKLAPFSLPPILNLEPADFFVELSDQYLYAALHHIFYASLMAENQRRVQHLDGAISHLDDEAVELRRKSNALRQEEIIEEIEVILLSAASLSKPSPRPQ